MRTILVTGGAGFIGSCFVRMTIETTGAEVVTLDKLTHAGGTAALDPLAGEPRHRFVQGDICDQPLLADLLARHRVSAVVNFAAESHVDRSIVQPDDFVQTNVVGTLRLLQACRRYRAGLAGAERRQFRFLQVSSDEVYGSLELAGLFDEGSRLAPNSPYSASKAAADHFVRAYHKTYGLPVLTTRSSNNYGPYQLSEKLIPRMILSAAAGRRLPLYGDGLHQRDWIFVEDNCRAIQAVLQHGRPGRTYNVGSGQPRTNLQVAEAICRIVDRLHPHTSAAPRESLISFVADRPGHDRRYAVDTARIRDELGWRPTTDFDAGLEKTVRWYLQNTAWTAAVGPGDFAGWDSFEENE